MTSAFADGFFDLISSSKPTSPLVIGSSPKSSWSFGSESNTTSGFTSIFTVALTVDSFKEPPTSLLSIRPFATSVTDMVGCP